MDSAQLFNNIFCIPHGDKYIIYQPLLGIIMLVNNTFVDRLYEARLGYPHALEELDVDKNLINYLFESDNQFEHIVIPQDPPPFEPTCVSLFLTNNCTLNCSYCYAEGGANRRNMSWKMIKKVLDEILQNVLSKKIDRVIINFHGGGDVSASWPLLVRTREYLSSLFLPHDINIITSLGSNGILNPKQQQWIISNIDNVTVSIDGPPDIQNNQRPFPDGKPSFRYVDSTLKAFDDANFNYAIRSTITSDSVFQMEEIISYFCQHYNARKIKFEPMYPRGRAHKLKIQPPASDIFIEKFRKSRKIARKAGRDLIYSGARLEVVTNVFCQAAGNSCAITPEGWITSCYECLSLSDPLSSIFFYGQYDYILKRIKINEDKRKSLYQLNVQNKEFCAKCFCKWHCAGDCPAKSIHAERTSNQFLPDRCLINRELTKDQIVEVLNNCN